MEQDGDKTIINVKKSYTDPVTGKFIEGNPGGGRPKGSLSFITKWERLIEKLSVQNNISVNDIDEQLLLVAYRKAKEGDYSFYRDIMDRIHGKPNQQTELSGEVTTKAELTDEQLDRIIKQRTEESRG